MGRPPRPPRGFNDTADLNGFLKGLQALRAPAPAVPPVVPAKGDPLARRQGQWLWNAMVDAFKSVPVISGRREMPSTRGNYLEDMLKDPGLIDQIQLALEGRGFSQAEPFGKNAQGPIYPAGQERVVFDAGGVLGKDGKVIKVGLPWTGRSNDPNYVHPRIWGTEGAMPEEIFRGLLQQHTALPREATATIQPKVWMAQEHPVFSKDARLPSPLTIARQNAEVLNKAFGYQGYKWLDAHGGNLGWLPKAGEYLPVAIDGTFKQIPKVGQQPFVPPKFRDPNYSWLIAALAGSGALAAGGQSRASEPAGQPGGEKPGENFGFVRGPDGKLSLPPDMAGELFVRNEDGSVSAAPEKDRRQFVTGKLSDNPRPAVPSEPGYGDFYRAVDEELNLPTITPATMKAVTGIEYASNKTPLDLISTLANKQALAVVGDDMSKMSQVLQLRDQIRDAAIGSIRGQPRDGDAGKMGSAVHQQMVGVLRMQSPGGETSDKSGVSQEEFDMLSKKHGMNANFIYPDRLQNNFDALRQAEFFSAMTPEYAPASTASQILKGVASAIPNLPWNSPDGKVYGDTDTRKSLFDNAQTGDRWKDMENRARDAMRWRGYAMPDTDGDGYQSFRDLNTNDSKYQRYSTLTPEGLIGALGEDSSRVWSRMRNYTTPFMAERNLDANDREAYRQIRNAGMRPVPIIPKGMTPEGVDTATAATKDYADKSNAAREAFVAKYTGGYPSGFAGSVINLDRFLSEPDVIVDYGLGGTVSAAKTLGRTGVKGLAKSVIAPAASAFGRDLFPNAAESAALRNNVIPAMRAGGGAVGFQAVQEGTTENPVFESGMNLGLGNTFQNTFLGKEDNDLMEGVQPLDPTYGEEFDKRYKEMNEGMKKTADDWRKNTGQERKIPYMWSPIGAAGAAIR